MTQSRTPDAPQALTSLRSTWTRWLLLGGLLAYGLLLARYSCVVAGGSDSSGYLNNARLLSDGRLSLPMRQVPGLDPASLPSYLYVPLGFVPQADHTHLTPTYPMGLPLLIAATARIVGWDLAPGLVIGLHALVGLLLMYRLGCEFGLEAGWAWLGALLLGGNTLYLMMSFQMMSDVPATVWVMAAVLSAWRSREESWLAFLAGMALSIAVLVRPTNLLAVFPVAIALGLRPRLWLRLVAGGVPGAIFQGAVNYFAYGRILTTGYGDVGSMFSSANVPGTLVHYALWLPVLLTPLVVLALGLPWFCRRQPRKVAVLASWALALLVFYLFYSVTQSAWWCLRFVLPAFPALLVAALLVARAAAGRFKGGPRAWWLVPATLVILVNAGILFRHFHLKSVGRSERAYAEVADWMKSNLPAHAVVAAMQTSGTLLYYTDFTLFRWDQISSSDFQRIAAACRAAHLPLYAALFPFEIEDKDWGAFRQHLGDGWTKSTSFRQVTIWRYDFPAQRLPAPPGAQNGVDRIRTRRTDDGRTAIALR